MSMARPAGTMSNCVTFQTKLSSIVNVLVQAAVAVIDNLVDEDSAFTLRFKVDGVDSEVQKKKIQTQNEIISTRFASIMGILGKEAVEKIIKLVDETKPELMECEIGTVQEASPENHVKVEESFQDVCMENEEPFIVVNDEDSQLDPVILKGKDMFEGKGGRSWVWGHFTLLSPNKVQCGLCNNLLSYYKNTSGMLRHIRSRHPAVHQCDTPSIVMAAIQTESDGMIGRSELDADMEMPEGRIGRSWVWDYFTLLNPNKVKCGLCENLLSYNKNTSGMLRHIRTRHPAAILIGASAAHTDPEAFLGQAELEVELDSSEGRGGRSWVWDHFTLFPPNKVRCSFCKNMLSYNKNTSGMLRHIRSRHPSVHQCANSVFVGAEAKRDLGDSAEPPLMREEKPEEDSGSTDPPQALKISAHGAVESVSDVGVRSHFHSVPSVLCCYEGGDNAQPTRKVKFCYQKQDNSVRSGSFSTANRKKTRSRAGREERSCSVAHVVGNVFMLPSVTPTISQGRISHQPL